MTLVILIIIGMKREKVPPCLISVLLSHTSGRRLGVGRVMLQFAINKQKRK